MTNGGQGSETATSIGWTVRGHLEPGAGGDLVLVVDEHSDTTVFVDPAGRGWYADSLAPLRRMRVPLVKEQAPMLGRAVAAMVRATPHAEEMPRLLRCLLELMGPAPSFQQGQDSDALEVPLEPQFGPPLPRAGELNMPPAGEAPGARIWRAPADDAALLEGKVVALLRGDDVLVLDAIASRVWREACGVTLDELTRRLDMPLDGLRRTVQDMELSGLLAAEPAWYIRDTTARALSADGHTFYLVSVTDGGPPIAIGGPGAAVWATLEELGRPMQASAIAAKLREDHALSEDIDADVLAFLRSLAVAGVVGY